MSDQTPEHIAAEIVGRYLDKPSWVQMECNIAAAVREAEVENVRLRALLDQVLQCTRIPWVHGASSIPPKLWSDISAALAPKETP